MAYGLECGHSGDGRRFQVTGCASPVAARLSRAGRGFPRSWDCLQSGETATLRSAGTVVSRQVSRSRPGSGEFRKSFTSTRTPFLRRTFFCLRARLLRRPRTRGLRSIAHSLPARGKGAPPAFAKSIAGHGRAPENSCKRENYSLMRFAIFSDIHGNLEALEAVLSDARERHCTHFICLGDIVGYNANPRECVEIVRDLDCPTVKGNHDEQASQPEASGDFNEMAERAMTWTRFHHCSRYSRYSSAVGLRLSRSRCRCQFHLSTHRRLFFWSHPYSMRFYSARARPSHSAGTNSRRIWQKIFC